MPGHARADAARLSPVQMCSLLDSVRALYEARTSAEMRDVLTRHVLDLVREVVPADGGTLEFNDESAAKRDGTTAQIRVSRVDGTRFKVTAPLLVQGQRLGDLVLERQHTTFAEPELLAISAVSRMAGLAVAQARYVNSLEEEVQRLRRDLLFDDNMAGESQVLERLKRDIRRVAERETTALITGESGTGKELVARSIHGQSPRANRPFVAINCAALAETLVESELFGHEKGAFTGAATQKRGLLEAAQGGTIFLDEIGEMSLGAQAKLLRILQNRELQRVGGTDVIPLDVRVIAATNRDLSAAVRKGIFREDLFYRLNVVKLRTPPLRERPEDILPLAKHFLGRLAPKCGRLGVEIAPDARKVLQTYRWPGNVRELENAIEHALVLGSGEMLYPEDLPHELVEHWAEASPEDSGMLQRAVNSAKRAVVRRAFDMAGGDHSRAAQLLGVHPNYLYRLLQNLNLSAEGL